MKVVDALNQVKNETSSIEKYYVCPMCEIMYFTREEARDYCPVQIDTVYYCTVCDTVYDSAVHAELCTHGG